MLDLYKSLYEISNNAKLKKYPDGSSVLIVTNKAIFRDKEWENSKHNLDKSTPRIVTDTPRDDSINRARQKVIDITRMNSFRWFITWTLDGQKINRSDPKEVSTKLKTFLMNKVQRNNLNYLIIPEYHRDNLSIHIHGLINGIFEMQDSGKITNNNQAIYNMPDWKYGFSTAIEIDNNNKAISQYVTKYLNKDFRKIFGNFYYAGGNILREPPTEFFNIDYNSIHTKEYKNEYMSFKYIEFDDKKTLEQFLAEYTSE
ncbi:MAG: hypothetical protein LBC73_09075 [Oscillospiraceae bacterium]|jgi:hypothetical protein|nr:hypothetical protein [Oscillospiraceae bacterium]